MDLLTYRENSVIVIFSDTIVGVLANRPLSFYKVHYPDDVNERELKKSTPLVLILCTTLGIPLVLLAIAVCVVL